MHASVLLSVSAHMNCSQVFQSKAGQTAAASYTISNYSFIPALQQYLPEKGNPHGESFWAQHNYSVPD